MAYRFRCPNRPAVYSMDPRHPALQFTQLMGLGVLITNGVATEALYPTEQAVNNADYVYLGGYDHIISEEEKTMLEGYGYADNIEVV